MTRRGLLFAAATLPIAAYGAAPARVGELPSGGAWARFADASAAWPKYLRDLPLLPEGTAVTDYLGRATGLDALRVVDLPLVPGDLQQCADSILRLRASYLRAQGADPAFRYTSGFVSRWSAWARGDRPVVVNNKVSVRATRVVDSSDAAFERWLANLFMYAGTYSLVRDTVAVEAGPADVQPGDVLVYGGSPGHAVLILDTADDADQRYVLVGQGFMPAQQFHVCRGPQSGWFAVSGATLPTQPLTVPWSGLRRFEG